MRGKAVTAILKEAIETFSFFTGLTSNIAKSKTAVIEALVQIIAWGITCIDLQNMG